MFVKSAFKFNDAGLVPTSTILLLLFFVYSLLSAVLTANSAHPTELVISAVAGAPDESFFLVKMVVMSKYPLQSYLILLELCFLHLVALL